MAIWIKLQYKFDSTWACRNFYEKKIKRLIFVVDCFTEATFQNGNYATVNNERRNKIIRRSQSTVYYMKQTRQYNQNIWARNDLQLHNTKELVKPV
jgi:hypothetical protein